MSGAGGGFTRDRTARPERRAAAALRALRTPALIGAIVVSASPAHAIANTVLDSQMAIGRLVGVGVAFAVFALGLRARARGESRRARGLRLGTLVVLAAVSYASYYYFFQFYKARGFDVEDVYLYYMGSKFAPELGYFGLYECSVAALVESGAVEAGALPPVRDLRTLRMIDSRRALVRGKRCREERFETARWAEFSADVGWFYARMSPKQFQHVLGDHGYHPAPAWTAIARPLSSSLAVEANGPLWLSRIDRGLVLATIVVVGLAFGLETACLVAIVWGASFLWRFAWIGDNFMRFTWLFAALSGLGVLARGWHASGGALLTLSTGLRLFPGIFGFGYVLHAARAVFDHRRLPDGALRFACGALAAGLLLFGASAVATQRGPDLWIEFLEKMAHFEDSPATNRVGLGVALTAVLDPASVRQDGDPVRRPPSWLPPTVRAITLGAALVLCVMLWRLMPNVLPWEAAALGFTLVPLVQNPTNYYYAFVLAAAPLASRRPRIGLYLLGATACWIAGGIAYYSRTEEFVIASWVASLLSFAVVLEMGRPPQLDRPAPAADGR